MREYKKEYYKKWCEENKEYQKEYAKKYYQENKKKMKEKAKEYYEENKERNKERDREYYQKNKEKIKEYKKEYSKTEVGKKSNRIKQWKQRGVVCDDFDALYDKYINTWNCENCNVELVEGKCGNNKRCLDHDHTTSLFRAILCNYCNSVIFREPKNNI